MKIRSLNVDGENWISPREVAVALEVFIGKMQVGLLQGKKYDPVCVVQLLKEQFEEMK